MALDYHRGESASPKGHAFVYLRDASNQEDVWATYAVVLPITVDVSKYVPPFLMSQIGEADAREMSAFAFPPAPERVGSYSELESMAEARGDDIISVGAHNPSDITGAMSRIAEAVREYSEAYARIVGQPGSKPDADSPSDEEGLNVNDVLYSIMSDGEKLGELTKLIGRLRFAVDGADARLISETEYEIALMATHLPDSHSIPDLVRAVKSNDRRSAALADCYLQRSYHLVHEEYAKLADIEGRIRELEEGRGAA